MSILNVLSTFGSAPRSTPALQQWLNLILAVLQPVPHLQFSSGDHDPSDSELDALFPGEKDKAMAIWVNTLAATTQLWLNNAGVWVSFVDNAIGTPTGGLVPFAGDETAAAALAPTYLLCDGHAVSRTTYSALFTALGTAWGSGDGVNTFNVPDLRGRVTVGRDNMGGYVAGRITAAAANLLGGVGGEETHLLIDTEMPSHRHTIDLASGSGTGSTAYRGNTSVATTMNTSYVGGGQAHNNLQPYAALNYIIKT